MKRLISVFILTMMGLSHHSLYCQQNLVKNFDMEEYDLCPNLAWHFNGYIKDWYNPFTSSPGYSPCYMNNCANSSTIVSVPYNYGGFQQPHSGNAYLLSGTIFKFEDVIIGLEPFFGILNSPLVKDKIYYLEFYVSLCGRTNSFSDAFDLVLTDDSTSYNEIHDYPGEIYWSNPTGNFISDSVNWVKMGGCFKAKGGEKYFGMGAFRDTNTIGLISHIPCDPCGAAYYYDDFSIYECDTCCLDEFPIEEYINIFPNPGSLQNVNVFVSKDHTSKIELFDAAGKLVWHNKFQEFYQNANLPVLVQGVYLWRYISSTGFSKTGKIITIK